MIKFAWGILREGACRFNLSSSIHTGSLDKYSNFHAGGSEKMTVDREFCRRQALDLAWEAARAGVRVLAVECAAAPDSLTITGPVPVRL